MPKVLWQHSGKNLKPSREVREHPRVDSVWVESQRLSRVSKAEKVEKGTPVRGSIKCKSIGVKENMAYLVNCYLLGLARVQWFLNQDFAETRDSFTLKISLKAIELKYKVCVGRTVEGWEWRGRVRNQIMEHEPC